MIEINATDESLKVYSKLKSSNSLSIRTFKITEIPCALNKPCYSDGSPCDVNS